MPRKSRLYFGVMPEAGGRWVEVGMVSAGGSNWCIFRDREGAKGNWCEVRVVAVGAAPNKASYWLGWNRAERRLRKGGDCLKLVTHRPALAELVSAELARVSDAPA